MSNYERMVERYRSGSVPWDDEMPPPEVAAALTQLKPGRALDLGCGYGRSSIYLAQNGWRVVGIDFVPEAIAEAVKRAQAAGVSDRVQFHVASVLALDFLDDLYDLALDIGCMHAFNELELQAYAAGLRRLLRPGAHFLLFARLAQPDTAAPGNGPRGAPEETVRQLFAADFVLEEVVYGVTEVEDQPRWASAWFYFRRRSA